MINNDNINNNDETGIIPDNDCAMLFSNGLRVLVGVTAYTQGHFKMGMFRVLFSNTIDPLTQAQFNRLVNLILVPLYERQAIIIDTKNNRILLTDIGKAAIRGYIEESKVAQDSLSIIMQDSGDLQGR